MLRAAYFSDIADQDQNQGNETTDTNGDSLSTVQTSTVAPSPRMVQHTSETEIGTL